MINIFSRLPGNSPKVHQFTHRVRCYPLTLRHRHTPSRSPLVATSYRKMIKFIREFGSSFSGEYMRFLVARQSILTPTPLPTTKLTKLGFTLAFGRNSPGPHRYNFTFYYGGNDSLTGKNILRHDEVHKDGSITPDPRLECQIALRSAPGNGIAGHDDTEDQC